MTKPKINSWSDAAYRHYNPAEGYGSEDEWIAAAEALASGGTILITRTRQHPDLEKLYLSEMPQTIAELKRAFRNTLFIVHPDYGGTNEACREALAAFERLSHAYQKP